MHRPRGVYTDKYGTFIGLNYFFIFSYGKKKFFLIIDKVKHDTTVYTKTLLLCCLVIMAWSLPPMPGPMYPGIDVMPEKSGPLAMDIEIYLKLCYPTFKCLNIEETFAKFLHVIWHTCLTCTSCWLHF